MPSGLRGCSLSTSPLQLAVLVAIPENWLLRHRGVLLAGRGHQCPEGSFGQKITTVLGSALAGDHHRSTLLRGW